jgi:DMSO/TMAO reductase YedYZ heme-binding membrane subunit
MSRKQRHGLLATACTVLTAGAWWLGPAAGALDRTSLLTAWLSTALFIAALGIGPLLLHQGRLPPGNILLRRDLGIWTALTGLLHFVLGNMEAMNSSYLAAVSGDMAWRAQMFNWGAIFGTLLAVIFIVLLTISNNRALSRLGPVRWKRWQRLSYFGFVLTLAHGLLFQLLERRPGALIALMLLAGLSIISLQLISRGRYTRLRQASKS